jgi:hypothetical protein
MAIQEQKHKEMFLYESQRALKVAKTINTLAEVWISSTANGTTQNTNTWKTIYMNNSTANARYRALDVRTWNLR